MQKPESGLQFHVPEHQKPGTEQDQVEHSENLAETQPQQTAHATPGQKAEGPGVVGVKEPFPAQPVPLEKVLEPGSPEAYSVSAEDNKRYHKIMEKFLQGGDLSQFNDLTYGESQNQDEAA